MPTQEELEAQATQRLNMAANTQPAQQDPYTQARMAFGLVPASPYGPPDPGKAFGGPNPYVVNPAGQLLFKNGVMVDPEAGSIMFPSFSSGIDPENVPGSPQWLLKVQKEWDEEKVSQWRKDLADQGYNVVEEGGWAVDLRDALAAYHQNRYLNYGNPIPLVPRTQADRESLRKQVDFQVLKEDIKAWGQVVFDEPLDEVAADYFTQRTFDVAARLMKQRGWTIDQAMQGANVRVQKEFVNSPGVKGALQDAEDDEMDETLRDSIVSIAQIGSV